MKNFKLQPSEHFPTLETKFGNIVVNADEALFFAHGILGFPEHKNFCLINCPLEKFKNFMILQSFSDNDVIFLVLSVTPKNSKFHIIQDLEETLELLGINNPNINMALIVSAQKFGKDNILTVNVKAPIFIDHVNKLAIQAVLPNDNYQIRQPL